MKYLLDTNIASAFSDTSNKHHNNVFEKISSLNDDDVLYISVLTLFEFEYSFSCCLDSNKQHAINTTIYKIKSVFDRIDLSENEAKIFGDIKSKIKHKTGIKPENMKKLNIDIMIASSAISNSCVVVSDDKIFKTISELVPNLMSENWFLT